MPPQTVLITGATDGIGLALARRYRQRQARLILVGRRALEELFTPDTYCRADLSRRDCADVVLAFLTAHDIGQLDVLINNAGTGYYGPLEEQAAQNIRTVVSVNLRAPIALTHRLLPHVCRARGRLVFISSVVSAMPAPKYPVYGATKAAIDGFARSLRIELRDDPVAVLLVQPGGTKTGLHDKIGAPRDEDFPTAEQVATEILAAIDRGAVTTTIGVGNKLMRFAGQHLAGFLDSAMRLGRRLR